MLYNDCTAKTKHFVGVLQVVNKKFDGSFNTTDEILLQMFSSYCALILRFSKTRKQLKLMVKIS